MHARDECRHAKLHCRVVSVDGRQCNRLIMGHVLYFSAAYTAGLLDLVFDRWLNSLIKVFLHVQEGCCWTCFHQALYSKCFRSVTCMAGQTYGSHTNYVEATDAINQSTYPHLYFLLIHRTLDPLFGLP